MRMEASNEPKTIKNTLRKTSDILKMFNFNMEQPKSSGLVVTDYNPKVKFEINSLNGILTNVMNQMRSQQEEYY